MLKTSPFLRISAELRNEIYGLLFPLIRERLRFPKPECVQLRPAEDDDSVLVSRLPATATLHPQILYTCRTIYLEASAVFDRTGKLVFHEPASLFNIRYLAPAEFIRIRNVELGVDVDDDNEFGTSTGGALPVGMCKRLTELLSSGTQARLKFLDTFTIVLRVRNGIPTRPLSSSDIWRCKVSLVERWWYERAPARELWETLLETAPHSFPGFRITKQVRYVFEEDVENALPLMDTFVLSLSHPKQAKRQSGNYAHIVRYREGSKDIKKIWNGSIVQERDWDRDDYSISGWFSRYDEEFERERLSFQTAREAAIRLGFPAEQTIEKSES